MLIENEEVHWVKNKFNVFRHTLATNLGLLNLR